MATTAARSIMDGITKSQRMLTESEAKYMALRGGFCDEERDVSCCCVFCYFQPFSFLYYLPVVVILYVYSYARLRNTSAMSGGKQIEMQRESKRKQLPSHLCLLLSHLPCPPALSPCSPSLPLPLATKHKPPPSFPPCLSRSRSRSCSCNSTCSCLYSCL